MPRPPQNFTKATDTLLSNPAEKEANNKQAQKHWLHFLATNLIRSFDDNFNKWLSHLSEDTCVVDRPGQYTAQLYTVRSYTAIPDNSVTVNSGDATATHTMIIYAFKLPATK